MTWHTEVCQWHTCATEVPNQIARSGLKLTLHRVSARLTRSEILGTLAHQKVTNLVSLPDHVGAEVSVRACGAHSVCGSSFFSVKNTGVPVCQDQLAGSRALWSSATMAIDAQSDSASIPVLTAAVTRRRAAG